MSGVDRNFDPMYQSVSGSLTTLDFEVRPAPHVGDRVRVDPELACVLDLPELVGKLWDVRWEGRPALHFGTWKGNHDSILRVKATLCGIHTVCAVSCPDRIRELSVDDIRL